MNFYYDPILGLQYTNLDSAIILDIEAIPPSLFDFEKWMWYLKEMGVGMFQPLEDCSVEITGQITEYKL